VPRNRGKISIGTNNRMPKEALNDWLQKATRESSEASPNPRETKGEDFE